MSNRGKMNLLKTKKDRLIFILKQFDSLLVAFSGGVDSTFLLAVATEVLKKKLVAVTAESPIHQAREKENAIEIAKNLGLNHILVQSKEINRSDFIANRKDRCYICKKSLFEDLLKIASDLGIKYIADGTNADDPADFRPGLTAVREMGIITPLLDANLTKNEIRRLSKEMFLPTWNKPPMACLATRIPYGTPITRKALEMVQRAENVILNLGFISCRVRHHGELARIEVSPGDLEKILKERNRIIIIKKFKEIGFSRVSLDMEGYAEVRYFKASKI